MLRYECINDSSHVFKGRNGMLEGVTCPVCEGQILANYFDKQVHNALPEYMRIRETKIIIKFAPDADIAEEKRKLSEAIRNQIRNVLVNL